MEAKDLKASKLLEAQSAVAGFLKYLNSEYENLKRLEAEKS